MDSIEASTWSALSGGHMAARGQFPQVFSDLSSRYAPRTMRDALWLCEYLYLNYGIYRKASERVVDYFLTKPNYRGQSAAEQKKFERIMNVDVKIIEKLREIALDRACYGNSFTSIHLPFVRMLRCTGCRSERNIRLTQFQFQASDYSFHAHCPKCKALKRHMVHDYANRDPKKIEMIRWDPKRIIIEPNRITGDTRYWLDIPADIQFKVRGGDPWILSTLPWAFIQAIRHNQRFLFNEGALYHMHEHTVAGLNLNGWGIPPILSAFKNFFRLQVLYRYDEVLKMDYIVPLRIISPAQLKLPAGNDFVSQNIQNFTSQASQAVARHRIDGADWNFFPFPVNYQAIGGEGAQIDQATRDSIQAEEDRLLNVCGVPPEFYRSSMSLQAAPVALRLFERGNTTLVSDLNHLLQWHTNTIASYLNSGDYETDLDPVRITDSLDDKAWRLQAAMSGAISKETGFGPLGINNAEEIKKIIAEQLDRQKAQQQAQQDQQMEAMSLNTDGSQGNQQSGLQQGGGMTPDDVEQMGDEKARQLLDPTLPEQNRRQELAALRNSNPTLHAVVIKQMEKYRSQNNQAGTSQAIQTPMPAK